MYRQTKQEEPEREILTALSMIDRQKRGIITISELRAKLTRLGEKLSEEEGILQFKDVSNAPYLLSFLIFLYSRLWDQVLPSWGSPEEPVPAGESAGAPLVGTEGMSPHHAPDAPCPAASRRAVVSPGPPHRRQSLSCRSHAMSSRLRFQRFAHVKLNPPG